jgi:hypothetical protein
MPAAAASAVGKKRPNTFLLWLKNTCHRRQKTEDSGQRTESRRRANLLQNTCIPDFDLIVLQHLTAF